MKKTIKRSIVLIILLSVILLIFTLCNMRREREALVNLDKLEFAFHTIMFDFQMVIDGEVVFRANLHARNAAHPLSPYFDPFYTELVFVHNQEEAQGFPDNVIVAWPGDRPHTQGVVNMLNYRVSLPAGELVGPSGRQTREPIILEDFGLTYPITIADLVDNWEGVVAVWKALTENERMDLR